MTEMEKVIKALECRLDINGSKYKHCLNCDYRHDIDHCQWACQPDGILEDALALLKAQEPRVMTPVEVMLAESVWLEDIDKEKVIHGLRCSSGSGKHWFVVSSMEAVSAMDADYGVRWRCWTSRPTDEQREATPWLT